MGIGINGIATKSGKTYVVANYSPAGNMQGQFAANVLPPGSKATTCSSSSGSGGQQATTSSPSIFQKVLNWIG